MNHDDHRSQSVSPAQTTDIQPQIDPPQGQTPPVNVTRKPLLFVVLAAIIILISLGSYVYAQSYNLKHASSSTTKATISAPTASPTKLLSTLPAVTTEQINGLSVNYLTIPINSTCAAAGIGACSAVTAMGHYMALDTTGIKYGGTINEGGKFIYDGQAVYNGPYSMYFALSKNGQHYIYTLDTSTSHSGGNLEVYVDNKLVQTTPDTSNDITNLTVSDNGKNYAYVMGVSGNQLIKDGTPTYTNNDGVIADFSSDLRQYLAFVGPGLKSSSNTVSVVLNGEIIANQRTYNGASLPSILMSKNGQHNLYTDGKTVYADGKLVKTVKGVAALALTESGTYGVVDPLSNKLYIDAADHAIPSQFGAECNPGCLDGVTVAINDDGTHYIVGDKTLPLWYLDGKQINLSDKKIVGTEFVNGSLYVYRWAD